MPFSYKMIMIYIKKKQRLDAKQATHHYLDQMMAYFIELYVIVP